MTNLVSIGIFSVGFLGICAFTQFTVDYVCRRLNLREEGAQ